MYSRMRLVQISEWNAYGKAQYDSAFSLGDSQVAMLRACEVFHDELYTREVTSDTQYYCFMREFAAWANATQPQGFPVEPQWLSANLTAWKDDMGPLGWYNATQVCLPCAIFTCVCVAVRAREYMCTRRRPYRSMLYVMHNNTRSDLPRLRIFNWLGCGQQ